MPESVEKFTIPKQYSTPYLGTDMFNRYCGPIQCRNGFTIDMPAPSIALLSILCEEARYPCERAAQRVARDHDVALRVLLPELVHIFNEDVEVPGRAGGGEGYAN
jgi:hypothetical protein